MNNVSDDVRSDMKNIIRDILLTKIPYKVRVLSKYGFGEEQREYEYVIEECPDAYLINIECYSPVHVKIGCFHKERGYHHLMARLSNGYVIEKTLFGMTLTLELEPFRWKEDDFVVGKIVLEFK